MYLTYRHADTQDVDACIAMLPDAFVCPPALRARLPEVWRRWLRDGLLFMTVLEDSGEEDGERRVGFGCGFFVSDAFADEVEGDIAPHLGAIAAQRWLEGISPILSSEEIRRANTQGTLNLMLLHIGWQTRLSADDSRAVRAKLLEAMLFFYRGYRLGRVQQQIYSHAEMLRGEAAGACVSNDFLPYFERLGTFPPPDHHPYLIGIRREEVREGSHIAPLFDYHPPRFGFHPPEQDILRLALLDQTDDEIAHGLNVSLSTVHKRWRAIHERVAAAAPALCPVPAADQRRGGERRRPLLSYLRHHPEELRPHLPQSKPFPQTSL